VELILVQPTALQVAVAVQPRQVLMEHQVKVAQAVRVIY
jgi:hypothetical protein